MLPFVSFSHPAVPWCFPDPFVSILFLVSSLSTSHPTEPLTSFFMLHLFGFLCCFPLLLHVLSFPPFLPLVGLRLPSCLFSVSCVSGAKKSWQVGAGRSQFASTKGDTVPLEAETPRRRGASGRGITICWVVSLNCVLFVLTWYLKFCLLLLIICVVLFCGIWLCC